MWLEHCNCFLSIHWNSSSISYCRCIFFLLFCLVYLVTCLFSIPNLTFESASFFFLPSIDCFSMYSLCSPLPQAQIIASWCDLFKKWYIQQYVCTLRIIDRRAGEVVAPLQITDLRKPLVWTFCPALIYGAPPGRRVGLVGRISRLLGWIWVTKKLWSNTRVFKGVIEAKSHLWTHFCGRLMFQPRNFSIWT